MMSNKIYEPIRRKIEEWIDYDMHSPNVPYLYNSFDIFSEHFTEVDMLNLAKKIMEWSLQICVEVNGENLMRCFC